MMRKRRQLSKLLGLKSTSEFVLPSYLLDFWLHFFFLFEKSFMLFMLVMHTVILDLRKLDHSCSSIFYFFSDFGSIFSTLLPGTMAKLEPPEGCSFLDGLEVRVAFGGVWKQSLSELSGGQRSLLALSLILALLLFKPAPLYILDEVCFA